LENKETTGAKLWTGVFVIAPKWAGMGLGTSWRHGKIKGVAGRWGDDSLGE